MTRWLGIPGVYPSISTSWQSSLARHFKLEPQSPLRRSSPPKTRPLQTLLWNSSIQTHEIHPVCSITCIWRQPRLYLLSFCTWWTVIYYHAVESVLEGIVVLYCFIFRYIEVAEQLKASWSWSGCGPIYIWLQSKPASQKWWLRQLKNGWLQLTQPFHLYCHHSHTIVTIIVALALTIVVRLSRSS